MKTTHTDAKNQKTRQYAAHHLCWRHQVHEDPEPAKYNLQHSVRQAVCKGSSPSKSGVECCINEYADMDGDGHLDDFRARVQVSA